MKCYKCSQQVPANQAFHGLHPKCFTAWFGINKLTDFSELVVKHTLDSVAESDFTSSFFMGKFKKYTALLAGKSYLIKIQAQHFPELPKLEFLCNQIAANMKISIPNYYLLRFNNKLDCFVNYNFMNDNYGSNLIHLYRFFGKKDKFDCQTIITILKNKTNDAATITSFIRLCIFDSLIGNHDRHGRNIALIQSANKLTLSPIYDNPSYIGIEDPELLTAQIEPHGKIATANNQNPSMQDYAKEFYNLKYNTELNNIYKSINIKNIQQLINNSFLTIERQQAMLTLINKRYQELSSVILP